MDGNLAYFVVPTWMDMVASGGAMGGGASRGGLDTSGGGIHGG